jgi:AraC-like DNA-binding protein
MNFDQNIDFTKMLLKKLHISSHIIENPEEYISSEIDKGLRAMLFGEENYSKLLVNSPKEAEENVIYRFYDEYLCNYIFFKIPNAQNDRYFYAGPYIPSLPPDEYFEKKAVSLHLSEAQKENMRNYYRSLPVVEEENILLCIMDTLGNFVFGGENNFNIECISYEIPDKRRPVYSSGIFEGNDNISTSLTLDIIEKNYRNERALIEAVSKGKLNQIDIIPASVMNQGTEERLTDSLRNRKNYLIILNTLLRKAAEYGEVHPYHIHILSSVFAQKIEELFSVESSIELQKEMILKYCLLVKEHSLKKYSSLIGKVITLISYDLSADLSLKHIAELMNVNASYLSAAFKKECGETLTEYVNRKRIEMATFILSHSNKQIQTIAEECGILDANYFIKLFKKQYGMTPTQYRERVK